MKNKILSLSLATLLLGTGLVQTGCFGSFSATVKLWNWNKSVTDSKIMQTLIFYGLNIIPIYGIAGAVDFFILNLIEFWTGSNPMSMKDGESQTQEMTGKDGNNYRVTATRNQFHIVQISGKEAGREYTLKFNDQKGTWNVIHQGQSQEIIRFTEQSGKVNAEFVVGGKVVSSNEVK